MGGRVVDDATQFRRYSYVARGCGLFTRARVQAERGEAERQGGELARSQNRTARWLIAMRWVLTTDLQVSRQDHLVGWVQTARGGRKVRGEEGTTWCLSHGRSNARS